MLDSILNMNPKSISTGFSNLKEANFMIGNCFWGQITYKTLILGQTSKVLFKEETAK